MIAVMFNRNMTNNSVSSIMVKAAPEIWDLNISFLGIDVVIN